MKVFYSIVSLAGSDLFRANAAYISAIVRRRADHLRLIVWSRRTDRLDYCSIWKVKLALRRIFALRDCVEIINGWGTESSEIDALFKEDECAIAWFFWSALKTAAGILNKLRPHIQMTVDICSVCVNVMKKTCRVIIYVDDGIVWKGEKFPSISAKAKVGYMSISLA